MNTNYFNDFLFKTLQLMVSKLLSGFLIQCHGPDPHFLQRHPQSFLLGDDQLPQKDATPLSSLLPTACPSLEENYSGCVKIGGGAQQGGGAVQRAGAGEAAP